MYHEIMFRGKRADTGEWVYGLPFYGLDGNMDGIESSPWCEHLYTVIPETIGQYTGVDDKRMKNIFNGDIVKTKYGRLCVIEWFYSRKHCGWDMIPVGTVNNILHTKSPDEYDLWHFENLEVVGNIHDNPELLKGE